MMKMTVKHEIPTDSGLPKTIGPYSQIVRGGDFLFVSGQAGINPKTGESAGSDFDSQARQAFLNLSSILEAAGSSMDKVVQTTVWLSDASKFTELNKLFSEFFTKIPPSRSTPIVQLPKGLLFGIECIALA